VRFSVGQGSQSVWPLSGGPPGTRAAGHALHPDQALWVRGFGCIRKIFAERLDPGIACASARRTERLEGLVQHLGLALGGRSGQSMARRLLLPVSKDTLLRTIRRRMTGSPEEPRVIGIADRAWRKGQRHGTPICDLERRRVIDLLAAREPATVAARLAGRPSIEVVARDRGGSSARPRAKRSRLPFRPLTGGISSRTRAPLS
jgi:hypothetical protein